MDASRLITLSRHALVAGLVLASAGAMAGGNQVNWSVNIDAPLQGSGRISTQMSNTRGGGYAPGYYAEPVAYMQPPAVMYAPPPPPRVVYAPQPVYYGAPPAYGYGWGHHHHHGARMARRVMTNVHNGLAQLHSDIANFHAARAQAWSQPGYGYAQQGYAQQGYGQGYGRGRGGDWR